MEETTTTTASSTPGSTSLLQQRLRKFKQKANQARQLNQQAVRLEAGTEQQPSNSKPKKKKPVVNSITEESAAESIRTATKRKEKEELNQYSVNDYHNPGGQYRNYVRNIKSIPNAHKPTDTTTDNSGELQVFRLLDTSTITTAEDAAADREGAHTIAEELHRRYAKAKKREQKRKNQQPDVEGSYINKRNKKFNEKISRNYDEHTAEIRQNLERGTAL